MMEAEQTRFIREEIKRQLNIILNAESGPTSADSMSETINKLFPGMPGIDSRPVMHPYGFASRAPEGMISVVAKVGADIHNRMTIGHRANDRPADLQPGECVLYSMGGQRYYIRNDRIELGSGEATEPTVLGNVLVSFFTELLNQIDMTLQTILTGPIAVSTAPGTPAPTHPLVVQALTQVKMAIDQAKETYISTADTNIISQEVFTQRGGQS